MQTTLPENVRWQLIPAAQEDTYKGPPREDRRWVTVFGPDADPKLAAKLFREDFAEYRRLKNVADFQQGNHR
jgi:hypothetical protein